MTANNFQYLDKYLSQYYEIYKATKQIEEDIYEHLLHLCQTEFKDLLQLSSSDTHRFHSKTDKRRSFSVSAKTIPGKLNFIKVIHFGICYREDINESVPFAWLDVAFKKQVDYKKFCDQIPDDMDPKDPDSGKYSWSNFDAKELSAELSYDETHARVGNLEELRQHLSFLLKRLFMDLENYCK